MAREEYEHIAGNQPVARFSIPLSRITSSGVSSGLAM